MHTERREFHPYARPVMRASSYPASYVRTYDLQLCTCSYACHLQHWT